MLLLLFCYIFFFRENYFYFFMFRDVPERSGMFRVPGFIDGLVSEQIPLSVFLAFNPPPVNSQCSYK